MGFRVAGEATKSPGLENIAPESGSSGTCSAFEPASAAAKNRGKPAPLGDACFGESGSRRLIWRGERNPRPTFSGNGSGAISMA